MRTANLAMRKKYTCRLLSGGLIEQSCEGLREPILILPSELSLNKPVANQSAPSHLLGYLSAITIMFIWSGWLVVSRSGAQSALTSFDLALLRYAVSAMVALPLVLYYKPWKTMGLWKMFVISLLLSPFYILLVFSGFNYAPAAHGGVFMNGLLPVLTLLIGWFWLSQLPSRIQAVGVVLIIVGTVLAAFDSSSFALVNSWKGDLMFIGGALFFSIYLVVSRLWQVSVMQVLLCGSVINALFYLPVWALFLSSGFSEVGQHELWLQVIYQGLVPNLIGISLVTVATRSIGSAATAAFMAGVPGMGAVLSFLILGEEPGLLGWLGFLPLTIGILMVALRSSSTQERKS